MFFWKNKNKKKQEEMIQNTPLGSCPPSSCGSCGEMGCESSSVPKQALSQNPDVNAINDKKAAVNKIKHIIAVGSGKGGVGKSTVTMNLAQALKLQGYTVGVLDADIYGPSQAGMLGAEKHKPVAFNGMIQPLTSDGIKFISMANLTSGTGPTIWRAPIAIQAIQQFLHGVYWGELDFLLVDLPPGTGDIQITLAQEAQLTGAVIVSTPQRVAAQVAKSGLEMFKQVNVPILGIVENMASFACGKCGEESKLFKSDALKKMAKETNTDILASVPLDAELMDSCDRGKSIFMTAADAPSAQAFTKLASQVLFKLSVAPKNEYAVENYRIEDDGSLEMNWKDGRTTHHDAKALRGLCQCAKCIDEITGEQILDINSISSEIKIAGAEPVGLYGVAITFTDGHNSGIYKLKELR